eukprot:6062106-Prymnesium_polylepis.1
MGRWRWRARTDAPGIASAAGPPLGTRGTRKRRRRCVAHHSVFLLITTVAKLHDRQQPIDVNLVAISTQISSHTGEVASLELNLLSDERWR